MNEGQRSAAKIFETATIKKGDATLVVNAHEWARDVANKTGLPAEGWKAVVAPTKEEAAETTSSVDWEQFDDTRIRGFMAQAGLNANTPRDESIAALEAKGFVPQG